MELKNLKKYDILKFRTFFQFVCLGETLQINRLVADDVNVNVKYVDEETPLLLAVLNSGNLSEYKSDKI